MLIYGVTEKDKAIWGTFRPEDLVNVLGPLYYTMMVLSGFLLITLIVVNGINIAGAPLNPSRRNDAIDFLKNLVLVGLLLGNLPTLYDLVYQVNSGIVQVFSSAYDSDAFKKYESFEIEVTTGEPVSGLLGLILISLVMLGLTLWANFYYFMRKVTLLILMAMGPIMIVCMLSNRFRGLTASWMKEFIGSVFVQSIHAFTFWTVTMVSATETSMISSVIVYIIFIPIAESIRKLLSMGGDMQGGLNKAGAMLGMAGLAGMYGSVKGAVQDRSVMSAMKGAYSGAKNATSGKDSKGGEGSDDLKSMNVGAKAGGDEGTTPGGSRMLKHGDIAGRMGKAALGMAGAVAGSPLGPVGSTIGASAGFAAGGAVGGLAGRMAGAAGEGIVSRFGKGKDAMNALKSSNDLGDSLASELADRNTASWADEHGESVKAGLRERFPDASESEIESKFQAAKDAKREAFHSDAKGEYNNALANGVNKAPGSDLVNASSRAMTDSWASQNVGAFNDEYAKNHPQMPGESTESYEARRAEAFNAKKADIYNSFKNAGQGFVDTHGADGQEPLSKADFMGHMRGQAVKIVGEDQADLVVSAGQMGVDHVTAASMVDGKGKPNVPFLASGLANAKTSEMKASFIEGQKAQGISIAAAEQDWNANHHVPKHTENLKNYRSAIENASQTPSGFKSLNPDSSKYTNFAKKSAAFVGGATGIIGGQQMIKDGYQAVVSGSQAASASAMLTEGAVPKAMAFVKSGVGTTIATHAAQQGGAVQAQQNFQNAAGFAGGMVLGAGGYRVAKKMASTASPYRKATQQEIHTPGEVMQMARTITDANGNVQVAPGAIRQVITPTSSHIEVQTKGGERQIVSRMGSGHSGMRNGETVYQDLTVQDGQLVSNSPATYRLDSAGGRAASNVVTSSNPARLLADDRGRGQSPITPKNVPVFSQAVDSGKFYTQDLTAQGFENVQVVIDKQQQFVTGQKDGQTYRVSQIFSGDSRMGTEETVQIPVTVADNQLRPTSYGQSQVGVSATVTSKGTTSPDQPYFSTKSTDGLISDINELIASKHLDRAKRSVNARQELDRVRRNQGFLG